MNDCECTNRTHNVTLSIAKALCIILMVIGHSGCPAYLHDWIYLFHMPCFFLISGYLLNDRNIENLGYGIKKRFKNLWYPYVKWSILFLLLHNVFYSWGFYLNKYSMNEIAIHAGKTLFFYGSEQLLWPYWFLSASLIASIIGLFYLKFFHSNLHLTHISITGGVMCALIATFINHIPISIPMFGSVQWLAASFFLTGYYFKRIHVLKIPSYVAVLLCIILVFIPILAVVDINANGMNCLIFFCTGIIGSIVILKASEHLSKTSLSRSLDYIGSKTLYVLTFHLLAFKIVSYLKIVHYNWDWHKLRAIPVIEDNNQYYWMLYSLVGLTVPLMIHQLIQILFCKYSLKNEL